MSCRVNASVLVPGTIQIAALEVVNSPRRMAYARLRPGRRAGYTSQVVGHPPLSADEIRERLSYARRRKEELVVLNGGDLPSADPEYRQQLVQEFFFHLVGAIDMLAQLVDEARGLNLGIEDASITRVIDALPQNDSLRSALEMLYANTRPNRPAPNDMYSDDGVIYRIWNYRHQVTHRRRQPFLFNIGIGTAFDFGPGLRGRWREWRFRRTHEIPEPPRSAHFILDPRIPPEVRNASMYSIPDELERMLALVAARCEVALALT
jgi:hypothetical protein